jgi:Protein of unknown function (DUF2917)
MSAILLTRWTDRKRRALRLAAPRILSLRGAAGTCVRCIRGRGWITVEGDPADYWISAGEAFQIRAATRVLIEADGCGELLVTLPREGYGTYASPLSSNLTV